MIALDVLIPQAQTNLYAPMDPMEPVVGCLLIAGLAACAVYCRWFKKLPRGN